MAHILRPPRRRTAIITAAIAVTVAALVFGLIRHTATGASSTAEGAAMTSTATAALVTFEKSVTASGTLTPTVAETLSFDAQGTVTEVAVEVGDTVTAGQELARIDTEQLDLNRLGAKAELLSARAALAEAKNAADGSDASDALLSARKAAVTVAKSAYVAAKDAMSDAVLVAPADGLVTAVDLAVGDVVSAGSNSGTSPAGGATGTTSTSTTGTISIVGTTQWSVSTTVSATDMANIAVGNQVEMTAGDISEPIFGVVSEIGRLPSTSSGAIAYPVTVTVTGDVDGLFDGVSVDISIIYSRRADVLAIPATAVTTSDGASTVQLVSDDETVTTTTVELGESAGDQVEITAGLTEGQQVQYEQFTGNRGENSSGQDGMGREGFPMGGDFSPPEGFTPPSGFTPPTGGGTGGGRR